MKRISNIAELRLAMRRNKRPIYFISPTNFNLMGIDEWVGNFKFINSIDCYDGRHPNVFVPSKITHARCKSIEGINNHLLQCEEVIDYIARGGPDPVAVFLMFDEKTEEICKKLGVEILLPTAKLRQHFDNKMETVRIGNKAGVPSVPNALGPARTYEELLSEARKAGLGTDLVVQTAFGDSGKTTFFIASEDDYNRHAAEISAEDEVKIMKRINCRSATMEACATTSGTLVGPLMTEIIGKPELTPCKGGWAGNEIFANAFSEEICAKARDMNIRLGDQLLQEGYRGCFNADSLVVPEDNEVYLGELNPRISGASSLINQAAFAFADAPLFLFHLMEFLGIEYDIDVEELNDRWAREEFIDSWSQLILKSTEDLVGTVTDAPATGIYRMAPDGSVSYDRFAYRWKAIENDGEAFFLRFTGAGDPLYDGADLGALIVRGRLTDDKSKLNKRALNWITGIKRLYVSKPVT
ncbi:biotin carboxylase [Rhizobium leguminosarum]|uniref:biotin carboxylase n=1 Tax=Rhizobium leguminosarum TaxID=384 RepID=UPI00103CAAE6|nr:biotin carboxylase [Rhizobium leguminosarum]TBY16886.1 biotin carboxylase [Rhizobium leguminosarum bv. viciae]TBY17248.1 biotin carboxylase [Rhizobium leguminosarum bv. viciae]TBY98857.1 biotin carboxylase [Rhizobium leguminosarum bv. viciae]